MREERTFINIDDGITVYVSDQKLKITAPINGRNVTIEFGKANGSSFHSLGVEIAKFFEVYTRTLTHWGEQHQVTLEHKVGLTENIFNKDLIRLSGFSREEDRDSLTIAMEGQDTQIHYLNSTIVTLLDFVDSGFDLSQILLDA